MAQNYENLDAWKKSITFAIFIYTLTKKFPRDELYGLTSQIRRAAISVSSNIAEGAGRGTKKDFLRFIMIALGSLNEVESQLYIAYHLQYLAEYEFQKAVRQAKDLGSILGGLRNYLKR